jgi:hypothetical protein
MERLRTDLKHDPLAPLWAAAGIYGGLAGGAAGAWLLWGWPSLATANLCILAKVPLVALGAFFSCAMGCAFVLTGNTVVKAIRRTRRPPSPFEPFEPIPEIDMVYGSRPGCGIVTLMPVVLLGLLLSAPAIYLAIRQVSALQFAVSALVMLPVGLAVARREAHHGVSVDTGAGPSRIL